MTPVLIHPPKSMLEVWESLPEGTRCQLINNQLIISPAPHNIHQLILNEININISLLLRKNKTGELRIAPFDVYFSKENILQPDILFVKNENLYKIKEKGLSGSPDLIIEILSPSTSKLDYGDKKMIYQQFGVSEYYIVDPASKSVDSFFLKDKDYEEQKKRVGQISSTILGAAIDF